VIIKITKKKINMAAGIVIGAVMAFVICFIFDPFDEHIK